MRLFDSFFSVTVASTMLSVTSAFAGMVTAILAGTPVGATIVAVDALAVGTEETDNVMGSGISDAEELPDEPILMNGTDGVDLDLTTLSATMVYSTVYDMMADPDPYRDKVIRMTGSCNVFEDPDNGKVYYSCLISDAAACCSQGLEFTLEDGEYPPDGAEITVTGLFDTYAEDVYEYSYLKDARLSVE